LQATRGASASNLAGDIINQAVQQNDKVINLNKTAGKKKAEFEVAL